MPGVERLLTGESAEVAVELSKRLVERPHARQEATQVGEDLRLLDAFFRSDARKLHDALRAAGRHGSFVAQEEREPLRGQGARLLRDARQRGAVEQARLERDPQAGAGERRQRRRLYLCRRGQRRFADRCGDRRTPQLAPLCGTGVRRSAIPQEQLRYRTHEDLAPTGVVRLYTCAVCRRMSAAPESPRIHEGGSRGRLQ